MILKKYQITRRNKHSVKTIYCFLIILLTIFPTKLAFPNEIIPLTQQEQLGRRIYLQGIGTSTIESSFVNLDARAPGSHFPCVKCHGETGKGGREASIRIADVSPEAYISRQFSQHDSKNNKNTDDLLLAAISEGIGPSGNTLHPAMPRYQMSKTDINNLISYLKRLGNEPIPGISNNEIRIGMPLPQNDSLSAISRDIAQLIKTYFDEINQSGGIYGRKLTLVHQSITASNSEMAQANFDSLFCLIASPPIDSALNDLISSENITSIAPLMIFPESAAIDANIFFMYASIQDQGRALIDFLNKVLVTRTETSALIYTHDAMAQSGAEGARQQAKMRKIPLAIDQSLGAGLKEIETIVDQLQQKNIQQIIYFGPVTEFSSLSKALQSRKLHPILLGSAELLGNMTAQMAGYQNVYLASSIGILDNESQGVSDYLHWVKKSGLSSPQNPFLLNAYVGIKVLLEVLKQNGKTLSRTSLIRTFENIKQFNSGVGPILKFSENQHHGTRAITVMSFDPKTGKLISRTPFDEVQ